MPAGHIGTYWWSLLGCQSTWCAVWGKLRPKSAGPAENANYPFGICDYRKKKFLDGRHAANYAAKYLTKIPAGGFPQWVFDFHGRIPRYSVNKGFWRDEVEAKPRKKSLRHRDSCQCDECVAHQIVPDPEYWETGPRRCKTIRQRVAACCGRSDLFYIKATRATDGEVINKETTWLGGMNVHLGELWKEFAGVSDGEAWPFMLHNPMQLQMVKSFVARLESERWREKWFQDQMVNRDATES